MSSSFCEARGSQEGQDGVVHIGRLVVRIMIREEDSLLGKTPR